MEYLNTTPTFMYCYPQTQIIRVNTLSIVPGMGKTQSIKVHAGGNLVLPRRAVNEEWRNEVVASTLAVPNLVRKTIVPY